MRRGSILLAMFVAVALCAPAVAEPPSYYLPDVERDAAIPEPDAVLGWGVGEWHVRHDQLVRYFEVLAEASPRVHLEEIGRTHEQRPLLHATITSERNHARLDEIRQRHQALVKNPTAAADFADLPVLVNLGYSVHGNEASGANASLAVAYHLASAGDETTRRWLDDLVIIIDPCLNPDGLARFAQWANTHRGAVPVADPQHREHREMWPNGRTNHYWFDLNRDWLPAQHPESQARLGAFHRWMPHVLADFHEMGTQSTYFFQPGVPSRKNPLTPDRNVELTHAFAERHAEALDELGSLYFTQELFDDYYYGKGSTYPDVHGAVGILFEQASSRGHVQDSPRARGGRLTFPQTILNQVATSFSTVRAAVELRQELLDYRKGFFAESLDQAREDQRRGWIVGEATDPERSARFAQLLLAHDVTVHALSDEVTVDGVKYAPGAAYVVPTDQVQYRLLLALFDTVSTFKDSTFYDVSTWTLPLAFDLSAAPLSDLTAVAGAALGEVVKPSAKAPGAEGTVAWAFAWSSYHAPLALRILQDADVVAQVATKPFTAGVHGGAEHSFSAGSIVVPKGLQTLQPEVLSAALAEAAAVGVEFHGITSGLARGGIDLGSPSAPVLEAPAPAILIGPGVGTYEAGEVWHLLDRRFGIETTLLEHSRLTRVRLDDYSHILMVDGDWHRLGDRGEEALRSWIRGGGVLVTMKRAAQWGERLIAAEKPEKHADDRKSADDESEEPKERLPYGEARQDAAVSIIGGSIFEVDLDRTHPLAFGFARDVLPVFRNSASILEAPSDPYVTVAAYTPKPLLSGYASPENVKRIAGSPAVIARRVQRGTVVQMIDPPSFRAFWLGTDKLLLNALFFGGVVQPTDRFRDEH
ncbi:MAG: M14 metallopeptidase family protein [Acidobacteriota bacterium]